MVFCCVAGLAIVFVAGFATGFEVGCVFCVAFGTTATFSVVVCFAAVAVFAFVASLFFADTFFLACALADNASTRDKDNMINLFKVKT